MDILHRISAHLPQLKENLHRSPVVRRIHSLLVLCAAVLTGLLPLMLWLLPVFVWYYLPFDLSADISGWTLAALLLTPFTAGFANNRWQRRPGQFKGAEPAMVLWLAGFAAYRWLFGSFDTTYALITLGLALLLGIAGGLTAERANKRAATPQTSTPQDTAGDTAAS